MDKTQIKVLLIEDNPVDIIFLREALEQDALNIFELTLVERLQSALEVLRENTYDNILLDLGLPDSQGLETFTQIYQAAPQTPKIILSGLTDDTLALQAVHIGAQDYIVKGTAGFASAPRAIRYAIERQQSQSALRASEERFRAMIEHGLDDISLLDTNGNLLWESPAVIRNLGYPENAFVGQNIFQIVHPEDQIWVTDLYAKLVQTPGSHEQGVFRLLHADGSWRWVEAIVTNMLDNPSVQAIVVNYRDITERKQANENLRSAREFLQGVQNALSAHIAILDGDSRIVQVNDAWRRFADQNGLKHPDYGIGLNYLDICDSATGLDSDKASMVAIKIRELLAGQIENTQIEYPCHSLEQKRWFNLHITGFQSGDQKWVVLAHENITERKQIEEALKETNEQFRTLFEASPEAILIIDPNNDWSILDCNATGCAMNGYTRAELIGQSVDVLHLTLRNPAERSKYLDRIREAGVLRYETAHRRKDGVVLSVEVSTSLITLGGREVVLRIDRDITERKRAVDALRESEALYRQAIEVAGAVPYRESYSDFGNSINYEFIGEGIRQITGYGPEEFNARVWDSLAEEANLVDDLKGYTIDEGIQRVRSGENPIWKCEFRIRDRVGKIHWVFETAVELRDEHGVSHGSIGMYQDITTRKQAENALRESEQRYRILFDASPVAIWEEDFSEVKKYLDTLKQQGVTDFKAYFDAHPEVISNCCLLIKVLNVNDTALQMYQAESKEQLIEAVNQTLSRGEVEHKYADFTAVAEGRTSNGWEGSDVTLTGKPIEVNLNWSVVPGYEHDFSKIIFTTIDITERKEAEKKLRESEARFASIFHTNPARVSITSFESGRFLDVNEAFLEASGYSREEVIGQTTLELDDWVILPDRMRLRALLEEQGSVHNFETQFRQKSGDILDMLLSAEMVDLFGQRCILSVGLDITNRKRGEQKLLEANERFRQLADNIQEVFWITDAVSGQDIYISPGAEKIWGRSVESLMHTPNVFIECILPEDRPTVSRALEKQRKGQRTAIEYRILQPDESVRWIWDRAFPVSDESGKVVRLAGIAADITDRKQAENALRQSEQRLRQVIDLVPHFIFAKDVDGRFILANQAVAEAYDTTVDELTNKMDADFAKSDEEVKHFRSDDLDVINSGQARFIPEENITDANGNSRILSTTKIPFTFSGSPSPAVLGVSIDITERKLAEKALRTSEVRFAGVVNSAMDAVISVDSEQRIVLFNPAAEQMFGCKASEAVGQLVERFIPDRYRTQHKEHILRFGQTGNTSRSMGHLIALSGLRSDGTEFPIEASISHIEAGGHHLYTVILRDITERKKAEIDTHRHLAELEALYENGLAVGQLLKPNEIGERIIATFARYLSWHHVAIRLKEPESDDLRLIVFKQDQLNELEKSNMESHLSSTVRKVGQGLSGWVVQTGKPLRTGNVHDQVQYVGTYPDIQSGLYMPLKIGDACIGVISVESEQPNAFTEQDERLLATLANQAAIAFENARLYQSAQQELQERKRMETELRISETHYRELADSITDIFFELDHDLRYSHWNKASESLTGVSAAEAIGKSLREIFGDSDEQARIEKIYDNVLAQKRPRTFETPFLVKDQIRSFEVNAYPSTHGVSVVAKDVTERKRSETIMQKRFELMEYAARHTLEEIMQQAVSEVSDLTGSPIGFFHTLDEDQSTPGLQIWPASTLSVFNVAVSEGQHRAVEQAGVWADAIRKRRAIIHNDYKSLSNKKRLPEGHAPIAREMIIPIIRNEKVLAVLGIANKTNEYTQQDLEMTERFADYAWDITERKQMEAALAEERNQLAQRVDERTVDLSRANANLARALRVKDEFLANMSHELRTPLNAILGLSESLAEQTAGMLNEKQQRYINTISESGHHLLSLINDILDLAKIEAGQIMLDINQVDILSVCDASMRMIKQLARKKNQEVSLDVESNLGLMQVDERRLKQMLVNLLSNAVKFTPPGGKLGLEVRGDHDQNKLSFTIWDTGIGIKEPDIIRLFQPFVQLDSGLARESSGTGLGLALVAQMARLHGGSTSVVSQPGVGSRFTIVLPWETFQAVDALEKLKSTGKFRPVKFNQDRKPIILLIEDTEDVIMMIADYLELNGFKVITARDGLEGVTQAELTHPDLILMDVQMPHMDGFEATQKLRSEPEFAQTPIIALTALAMPSDRERCLAAGMNEYITKPVHLRGLVKLIENFLSGEQEIRPQ